MNNLIRWALCQSFGREKGLVIFASLFGGPLGEAIRRTDALATQKALDAALSHLRP